MGTPSYIVRNRFGTYYFRVSLPKHIRALSPGLPKEIRRSLKTNIKSIALRKARLMWAEFYQFWDNRNQMKDKEARDNYLEEFNRSLFTPDHSGYFGHLLKIEQLKQLHKFNQRVNDTVKLSEPIKDMGDGKRLSQVIEEFIAENTNNGIWTDKTKEAVIVSLNLFMRVVGDVSFASIKFPETIAFKNLLIKLPLHLNNKKEFRGKTLEEIILSYEGNTLHPRTCNKHLTNTSQLFAWAECRDYTDKNYIQKLGQFLESGDKAREPFSEKELQLLFHTDEFKAINGKKFQNPHEFWLPLLSLHSGARIEELCQLHHSDIVQIEGIWCIDINKKEDKKLKNRSAIRIIPIHQNLLEIGFLNFTAKRKNNSSPRIFSEFVRVRGSLSHHPSNDFGDYKTSLGFPKQIKAFHSFRHTVLARMETMGVAENFAAAIAGHKKKKVTFGTYGNRNRDMTLSTLNTIVNEMKFNIDIAALKEAARLYQ